MDWLRSEDLKEEKDVTAPRVIIARQERLIWLSVPGHGAKLCTSWSAKDEGFPLIFLSQGWFC